MDSKGLLCYRTEECISLFKAVSSDPKSPDDDWLEDRAADFAWWAHGLKAQKTGRSSLDYRLRNRLDIQKTISGLLDSLVLSLNEILQTCKDFFRSWIPCSSQLAQEDDKDANERDASSESEESQNGSAWSEFSDADGYSKEAALTNAPFPESEAPDPRFYIKTNLELLAKTSIAIRRSGTKLRYLKADEYLKSHSDEDEYTQLRNHLLSITLVGPYELQLFNKLQCQCLEKRIMRSVEIVIRAWITDTARATPLLRQLVETNVKRRNRILYARKAFGDTSLSMKPREDSAVAATALPIPESPARPSAKSTTVDLDTESTPEDQMPLMMVPSTKSLTATELGSRFVLPIITPHESKKPLSVATQMTRTGEKQDYPPCPIDKGSFQCPYCFQVLPEEYSVKSRWRGHVAQDLNPYSCIYKGCPDYHELFTTKDEWMKHTTNRHSIDRWVCDECTFGDDLDKEPVFESEEDWKQHMSFHHKEKCDGPQLVLLSSLCRRQLAQLVDCPLCKRGTGLVRPDKDDHIAEHLHGWALRALPWDSNTVDEDSQQSQAIAGSSDDLAGMSTLSELSEPDEPSDDETMMEMLGRETAMWESYCLKLKYLHPGPDEAPLRTLSEDISYDSTRSWRKFLISEQYTLQMTPQQLEEVIGNLLSNAQAAAEDMMRLSGRHGGNMEDVDSDELFKPTTETISPFPKVEDKHLPLLGEAKEKILCDARDVVLSAQNVNMQLTWARDVLVWAQIAINFRNREDKMDGGSCESPDIEKRLTRSAVDIIEHFAGQNHPEALFREGTWYEFGLFGKPAERDEARKKYTQASELGHGHSEYRLGMLFEDAGDYVQAFEHYSIGRSRDNSASRCREAMAYLLGQHDHEQDLDHGLRLMGQAADEANEDAPQAAYLYGMILAGDLLGIAIPESLSTQLPSSNTKAKTYLEKAAFLGHTKAQLKMGEVYEFSLLGCDFHPRYSLHYYHLAAERCLPEAEMTLIRWFLYGHKDIVMKNAQLAFIYAKRAAHAGFPAGMFAVGYYYEIGVYMKKDIRTAKEWYEKATASGYWDPAKRVSAINKTLGLGEAPGLKPDWSAGQTPDGPVKQTPESPPRYIAVGIDLGTVFSSVSWALSTVPDRIHSISGWPHAAADSQYEVATQFDQSSDEWGSEHMLASLLRQSAENWRHSPSPLLEDFRRYSRNEATFVTFDTIVGYLKAIWQHTAIAISEYHTVIPVRVSMVVPTGLTTEGRQCLKHAAREAFCGEDPEIELVLIDQVEAAVIATVAACDTLKAGDAFIVCDCGAAKVRAVACEVSSTEPVRIKQLTSGAIAENGGSLAIDMQFLVHLLHKSGLRFGSSPAAHHELDLFIHEKWEQSLKRSFAGNEVDDFKLRLPRKALSRVWVLSQDIESDILTLSPDLLRSWFDGAFRSIQQSILSQEFELTNRRKNMKKTLLLGGLSLSPYLRRLLSRSNANLLDCYDETFIQTAVSKGAVMALLGQAEFDPLPSSALSGEEMDLETP